MITKVNNIELHILILFSDGYNKEHHIREVSKKIRVSSRTAQITLAKLEEKQILKSQIKGKNKAYKLTQTTISKEYLILTEQYKKILCIEKNHLIKEIIEKIEPHIQGTGIIFGSYAKGLEKKDSDLDIFIIGSCKEKEIEQIGKQYALHIQIKQYPKKIFEKNIYTDPLIKEIIQNHILIKNSEYFVKRCYYE
jgi:uncharacterized protein